MLGRTGSTTTDSDKLTASNAEWLRRAILNTFLLSPKPSCPNPHFGTKSLRRNQCNETVGSRTVCSRSVCRGQLTWLGENMAERVKVLLVLRRSWSNDLGSTWTLFVALRPWLRGITMIYLCLVTSNKQKNSVDKNSKKYTGTFETPKQVRILPNTK